MSASKTPLYIIQPIEPSFLSLPEVVYVVTNYHTGRVVGAYTTKDAAQQAILKAQMLPQQEPIQ